MNLNWLGLKISKIKSIGYIHTAFYRLDESIKLNINFGEQRPSAKKYFYRSLLFPSLQWVAYFG
ncbi:hypothetical protein Lsai_1463 [Legionella sainthelensi]|uniref:Uncharacterized protein n=1 Tax=Legionella sainthelensi TaxID=28087 RepID=A0A0W0YNL0_9GAMM|nr:hypothetical protein Lsai_1463 [Legionella sainthelensi]VEH30211.1 Uncharacterised protein [Legionella sainthelensi]